MAKPPCEKIIWLILPAVRKELAKSLIENYGLNQKQIAEILEISPAAVCQYLSNKRVPDVKTNGLAGVLVILLPHGQGQPG